LRMCERGIVFLFTLTQDKPRRTNPNNFRILKECEITWQR